MVLVSYKYDREIYESIKYVCDNIKLKLEVLYNSESLVPWIFN